MIISLALRPPFGFENEITDTSAIIHKHQDHPSVIKFEVNLEAC